MRARGPVEERLAGLWAEVLGVGRVGIHDNFFHLGGHSLLATRLIARVRRAFEVDLPVHAVFEGATVAGMAALIAERRTGAPAREVSPLITLQPSGDRPPLFFLHPVGGGVSSYAFVSRHLAPDQPCFGLQAPGLLDDREPFDRIEPMAALYVKAIRERWPEGPYLLAGWSLGGWLAFEVAQQLAAGGGDVALLALLDTSRIRPEEVEEEMDDATLLADLFNFDLERTGGGPWTLEAVIDEARSTGQVEETFGLDQARRLLRVLKSNAKALDAYVALPYPGRITLLRCDKSAVAGASADPTRGWGSVAIGGVGGVDIRPVPGSHASIVHEPHAGPVAETLRQAVGEALAVRLGVLSV